jgi:D-alanyl-D-alanine carboxypeptidase
MGDIMPTDDEIRKIIVKKKRRKAAFKRLVAAALLLIVLFLMLQSRQTSSFDYGVVQPIGDESAEAPKLKAEAASLYSLDLDRPVYEKNGDEKIDPYSITKILTCYLAYENLNPDDKVTITKETAEKDYEDGAYILLFEGEVLTVGDLLYSTMLASANDAAHALAVEVAGSEKKFAELMNETVKEWGCNDTHFVNPNGWKNKNHYTTAHDMAIITKHCFENEDVKKLSMVEDYTVPATNKFEAKDIFNVFLKSVDGIDNITCGKTGSWEDDDCSIVLEFEEDNLSEIMVLLRDTKKKRPDDIEKLMEFSHVVTPGFQVASEGETVAMARVKNGAETEVGLSIDKTIKAYPKDEKKKNIKVLVNPNKLEAPLKKGAEAGSYTVMVDGRELESGKLFVSDDVEKGWFLSRFYISNKKTLFGGAIVLVAAVLIILLRTVARKSKSN